MTIHAFDSSTLPVWQAFLLLSPALLTVTAALFASDRADTAAVWRGARWATGAGLGLAGLTLAATGYAGSAVGFGFRADTIGGAVMLLVAFVGWTIVRFSQPYLNGEREQRRYLRWLLAALAAVSVVIAANHVLLLALAWMATSIAMHRLLNFYGHRPAAVVAAHKKFIAARAADLCMLGAAALLASAFGTLQIDQMVAQAANGAANGAVLPLTAQAASLLIAVAALLKCAQLPFHGWLIQVMEAPTPVSALLHAGVVNLGGFVLIRFAPLVSEVPVAQILLVAVGAGTAVLAALVMATRISIKVMLAWSTCAQMGFMLMQCGLGAWEMALLHLLAHSLYKAHAFLGAGGTVREAMLQQLTLPPRTPSAVTLAIGAVVGLGTTAVAGAAWSLLYPQQTASPVIWVLAGIVSLALVPLVNGQAFQLGGSRRVALMVGAFAVAFTYFGLHLLFAKWVGSTASGLHAWLLLAVVVAFGLLFLIQCLIAIAPHSPTLRRLYPWFYGGLFLDEKLTHFLFSIWPPPQPRATVQPLPVIESTPTGVRS